MMRVHDRIDDGLYANDDIMVNLSELKKKAYPKKSKASVCREILGQLKRLTFTVYDMDALDSLHETLEDALRKFSFFTPKEDNLVVERKSVVRTTNHKSSTPRYKDFPKPKPKKSSLTGRVHGP